ncbi:structure-specific endonuclease subunit MUS81-like isoform X2 [Haemaphysalis longicornis]
MAAGVEGRRRGAQQQSAARLRQAGRVLGPLVERERTDDLAKSIMDGRFHEQKVHLVASGVRPLVYLVEEAGGRGSHCMADSALEQGVLNTQGHHSHRGSSPDRSVLVAVLPSHCCGASLD